MDSGSGKTTGVSVPVSAQENSGSSGNEPSRDSNRPTIEYDTSGGVK